jgi:hypothetical protein
MYILGILPSLCIFVGFLHMFIHIHGVLCKYYLYLCSFAYLFITYISFGLYVNRRTDNGCLNVKHVIIKGWRERSIFKINPEIVKINLDKFTTSIYKWARFLSPWCPLRLPYVA